MFWSFRSSDSYLDHLKSMMVPVPSVHQGWFLCYLFVYSQLLASLLITVHPNHQVKKLKHKDTGQHFQEDPSPRLNGLPIDKPISPVLQVFCCLNFFGYLTSTADEFVRGVKFWLGNPIKLAIGGLL